MKRFLLFAFEHYYPAGGLLDVAGSYDTAEEAMEAFSRTAGHCEECYILDREQWKVIQGEPPKQYNSATKTYEPIL